MHNNKKAEACFGRNFAVLNAFRRGCEGVSTEIAPDDEMTLPGHEREQSIYLYGGRSAFKVCIDALILANAPIPKKILDFPSGHGRALRYLRAGFPEAEIYAGDINQPGLDFCRDRFGAKTFPATVELAETTLPGNMDLILCGSLVTHFSEARAKQLIDMLCDALAPDGICLFSTHGRMYERYIGTDMPIIDVENWKGIVQDYSSTGYGYRDYKEYAHIQYGISLMKPAWLFDHIYTRDDLTVLFFAEKAWHGQHDVTAVQKRDLRAWYDHEFL